MRRTSLCATSAPPHVGPSPVTMFTTPAESTPPRARPSRARRAASGPRA
jgi:hypothetical protein